MFPTTRKGFSIEQKFAKNKILKNSHRKRQKKNGQKQIGKIEEFVENEEENILKSKDF